jgi:hypothetical protein
MKNLRSGLNLLNAHPHQECCVKIILILSFNHLLHSKDQALLEEIQIIFTLLSFIFDDQGSVLFPILTLGVIPVVCYSNTDTQKIQILHENNHKSGIYR